MSLNVTKADVMRALREDTEFTRGPDECNLKILRPFIPDLLKRVDINGANTLASSMTITKVIIGFTQDLLDSDYMREDEESFRQRYGLTDDFVRHHRMARVEPVTRTLKRLLETYQLHLKHHEAWLQGESLTEVEYMLEHMNLSRESKDLYLAGRLTLGRLLTTQPTVLLPDSHSLFLWDNSLD